jgi:neopullulanase
MYSNDLLYKDPMKLVTFLDNHDLNRFFTQVGEDVAKHKMAMGWLLTSRGIPQLYYGSEVIMKGATYPKDGWVRLDFPGGWPGDKKNAFTGQGLSTDEKSVQDFVKALANFRKNSSAIKTGATRQYIPKNDCYVYFRYDAKQTVMVVLNAGSKPQEIKLSDYPENTRGFSAAREVTTNAKYGVNFSVGGNTITVLELGL